MERVEAALNGSAQNLPEIGENRYQGKLNAPATKAKEVVYPVMITATGDNGGVTEETRDLIVRNADLFPLEFTIARKNGEELGFLDQSVAIDMDLGDADDFEICFAAGRVDKKSGTGTEIAFLYREQNTAES